MQEPLSSSNTPGGFFLHRSSAREAGVDEDNAKAKQHRWQTLQQGSFRRNPTRQWSYLSLQAHHHSWTTEARNYTLCQSLLASLGAMHITGTLQFPAQNNSCLHRKSHSRWNFTLCNTHAEPKNQCVSSASLQ